MEVIFPVCWRSSPLHGGPTVLSYHYPFSLTTVTHLAWGSVPEASVSESKFILYNENCNVKQVLLYWIIFLDQEKFFNSGYSWSVKILQGV